MFLLFCTASFAKALQLCTVGGAIIMSVVCFAMVGTKTGIWLCVSFSWLLCQVLFLIALPTALWFRTLFAWCLLVCPSSNLLSFGYQYLLNALILLQFCSIFAESAGHQFLLFFTFCCESHPEMVPPTDFLLVVYWLSLLHVITNSW